MKVTLKNGYIENYAIIGDLVDGIEVDESVIEDMEYFVDNSSAYHIVNGKLELDSERLETIKNEIEIEKLRKKRDEECFSYVDRSILWYNNLTNEEKEELSEWYQDWLNVTDTKVIPERPFLLNDQLCMTIENK